MIPVHSYRIELEFFFIESFRIGNIYKEKWRGGEKWKYSEYCKKKFVKKSELLRAFIIKQENEDESGGI